MFKQMVDREFWLRQNASLATRIRCQRNEIRNLHKIIEGRVARQPGAPLAVMAGSVVKDAFGALHGVSTWGPRGFVDTGGSRHYWSNGYTHASPAEAAGFKEARNG